ncbi:hypothetical protein ACF0H5_009645 [Mactra antiquata]
MQLNSSGYLFVLAYLISVIGSSLCEKILASVPNINVLLSDVNFMEVVQPSSISYTYKLRPARNFGTRLSRRYNGMELVLADPYYGCSSLSNTHLIENRIVMMLRGECSFVTKSIHAQEAGAVAVIITDNDMKNDQLFIDMVDDETEREVYIPAYFLLGKDGYVIRNTMESLNIDVAIINIPINVTNANVYNVKQPPWTLW